MKKNTTSEESGRPTAASNGMRCLIVVPSLNRAGAETQAVDLANGLAARGHSIHICSFKPDLGQRNRLSDEVRFHHVQRHSKYDMSLISRLAAIIERERIELVLGVMQFAMLVAWLAARRTNSRPPIVAAIHTTINRNLKEELHDRLIYRRVLRSLPAIVFVCEHQRTHWIRKFPELKHLSTVVHNGVAPERFHGDDFVESARRLRQELVVPEEAFVFACIAAFRQEKGHELLIDAFSKVGSNAYLVFAGDGELRNKMEAYAEAEGLSDRTRFLGNISDTRPLMKASNATVLASTAVETFSMAMLESMAIGVPMIAPRIGGLSEAIVDNETGLLFPIGDLSALARCMNHLVERPSEVERMGRAARQKVTEDFTLSIMVERTERAMLDVLDAT